MNYDVIIVGSGFSGATAARVLAEKYSKRVLLLEKRDHVGGNAYDRKDDAGVLIHQYGPHIFHTDDRDAFAFLEPFAEWIPYEHRVLGRIQGQLVPIPFNFTSIDKLFAADFAARVKKQLGEVFPGIAKVTVSELMARPEDDLQKLGQFVFDNVFKNYTAKQWGTPPSALDPAVINRVPVVLSYDDRYFRDSIQMMPKDGFTALFRQMLDHPNITVELSVDALSRLRLDTEAGRIYIDGQAFYGSLIYTGPADELFSFCYGELPYRSLYMDFETLHTDAYQSASVVNYPNEEDFTRISEFKKLTGQIIPGATTIMREYPRAYVRGDKEAGTPYYAILNEENRALHARYAALAAKIPGLFLCGRLAEYAYYNMDAAVAAAIKKAKEAAQWAQK